MPRPRLITADQVLAAIRATAHEVSSLDDVRKHLGLGSVRTIRRCLAELHQAGAIYNTSERRPNLSGRLATVWAMKQRRGT